MKDKETPGTPVNGNCQPAQPDKEPQPLFKTDSGFWRRIIALSIIAGIILLLFLARLIQFQFVDAGSYNPASTTSAVAIINFW